MSFVNPLFLIGGLAVAVPIVLHLMKREHARKIEFPTLMFLRRISKKTIRYQKLRHLLLLCLRILALLLIVLAFMRPYREQPTAAGGPGRPTTAHILLLDHSLSMAYQDRWEQARKAAAEIIRDADPADRFAVLEFSDRTTALTQFTDSSEARSRIESLKMSDRSTRFGQALRTAEKFAFDAGTGRRIIHLISDFQENGWSAEDRDFRLAAGIELRIVDVGSERFSNLAIRDVQLSNTDPGGDSSLNIKATVVNYGDMDRRDVQVRLLLDERSVAGKRIELGKGASQAVDFQLPGLLAGAHPVVLEIEDPNLTRDNRFCMTVEARGKTAVQLVEPDSAKGPRSPSFYLSKALNVDVFSPYRMTPASSRNLVISGGLLIWNSAPGGTAATQKKLQDFVKAGGGLAVIVGNADSGQDFNRTFGTWLPIQVLGAAATAANSRNRPVENFVLMTDVRMDHPIFQPFSRPNSGSFSSARFFEHVQISGGPGSEVLARFDNGDPALIVVQLGKGRVAVYASSADDSWNDLPLKAVYAPFWQQVLHYLENFQERRRWLDVGETLAPRKILVDAALRQAKGDVNVYDSVAVLDPERQRLTVAPGSDSIETEKAGFYEIRAMGVNAFVAVNPAPKESDLTHGKAEEVAAGWSSAKPATAASEERSTPEEQDRRQRIWSLLLLAATLLLLSELAMSNFRSGTDEKASTAASSSVVQRPSLTD